MGKMGKWGKVGENCKAAEQGDRQLRIVPKAIIKGSKRAPQGLQPIKSLMETGTRVPRPWANASEWNTKGKERRSKPCSGGAEGDGGGEGYRETARLIKQSASPICRRKVPRVLRRSPVRPAHACSFVCCGVDALPLSRGLVHPEKGVSIILGSKEGGKALPARSREAKSEQ